MNEKKAIYITIIIVLLFIIAYMAVSNDDVEDCRDYCSENFPQDKHCVEECMRAQGHEGQTEPLLP